VLDAFFRRWQLPAQPSSAFADTLSVADAVERFCLINLSADIEQLALDDLLGEGYDQRLAQAKARLREKHQLNG
jgi:hypothetical protein